MFLSILSSCYSTLDTKWLENATTLLSGYIGTYVIISVMFALSAHDCKILIDPFNNYLTTSLFST